MFTGSFMKHNRLVHTLIMQISLVVGLSVAAVGCSGTKPPPPVALTVVGTPQLNLGNAAIVRIYELNNDTNFRNATLETFWQDDRAALGNELVNSQQFMLYPDAVENIQVDPGEETRFIGIAANLRQPDREQWRQVYPVEDLRGKQVMIEIGEDRILLEVP